MTKEPSIHLHGNADLGDDASLMWVWRRPLDWPADKPWDPDRCGMFPDDVYGFILSHYPITSARACMTLVFVKPPYDHTSGMVWKVLEWDPLTLEKAIECPKCGVLGMIESGRWELV